MRLRFHSYVRLAVSFLALLLLLPTLISAQSVVTGALSGTITDPSNAVIVGANLNIKNNATCEMQTATSNADGGYQFSVLKPGTYTLTVTQQEFKQVTQTVEILRGQAFTSNRKT